MTWELWVLVGAAAIFVVMMVVDWYISISGQKEEKVIPEKLATIPDLRKSESIDIGKPENRWQPLSNEDDFPIRKPPQGGSGTAKMEDFYAWKPYGSAWVMYDGGYWINYFERKYTCFVDEKNPIEAIDDQGRKTKVYGEHVRIDTKQVNGKTGEEKVIRTWLWCTPNTKTINVKADAEFLAALKRM